ncbi:MAG: gamma-glutamylcyclotransferase [Candidatus Nanopelagicales bacterium]|nr:gamma-glutamylcyclotransferase [Candidatus Nanopelagicales bacterium]
MQHVLQAILVPMVRIADPVEQVPREIAPTGWVSVFSYGTLQLPQVQLETFGRAVETAAAVLPGYRLDDIEITDAAVVALSGVLRHPIVRRGGPGDSVAGALLVLTDAELAAADGYETDDYARTWCRLESGRGAWVYTA